MDLRISIGCGIITLIIVFLVDYFAVLLPKYKVISGKKTKKKDKKIYIMELQYLINHFKLDIKKIDLEYVIKWFAFLNAFIIAFTSAVIMLLPWNMFFQLLVGFVLLLALIYSLYELFGRHLVKKGWQK